MNHPHTARSEDVPVYGAEPDTPLGLSVTYNGDLSKLGPYWVSKALAYLHKTMVENTDEIFAVLDTVRQYCQLKLGALEHEVFMVLFLDPHLRLIEAQEMFRGTATQTSVYPREVVKEALRLNASNVIFTHNHPSGSTAPSRADELLTQTLKSALSLVDIRVIDHIIVTRNETMSLAQRGML